MIKKWEKGQEKVESQIGKEERVKRKVSQVGFLRKQTVR